MLLSPVQFESKAAILRSPFLPLQRALSEEFEVIDNWDWRQVWSNENVTQYGIFR